MGESDETGQQKIQFYGASVAAWFNTALEHDKSILTLSAAGIGLLVTLLTTTGISGAALLSLYIASVVSFLLSICGVLLIFKRNKYHIEQIISGKSKDADAVLSKLDTLVILAFAFGVVFSALIGISAGISSYVQRVQAMKESKVVPGQQVANDSFNSMAKLQPRGDLGKSFNHAGKLQPQAPAPAPAPAQQDTAAPVSAPVQPPAGETSGGNEP